MNIRNKIMFKKSTKYKLMLYGEEFGLFDTLKDAYDAIYDYLEGKVNDFKYSYPDRSETEIVNNLISIYSEGFGFNVQEINEFNPVLKEPKKTKPKKK